MVEHPHGYCLLPLCSFAFTHKLLSCKYVVLREPSFTSVAVVLCRKHCLCLSVHCCWLLSLSLDRPLEGWDRVTLRVVGLAKWTGIMRHQLPLQSEGKFTANFPPHFRPQNELGNPGYWVCCWFLIGRPYPDMRWVVSGGFNVSSWKHTYLCISLWISTESESQRT